MEALVAELQARMPAVPPPPPDAAHGWSEFEVQLYFSSGGAIKPKRRPKPKAPAPMTPALTEAPPRPPSPPPAAAPPPPVTGPRPPFPPKAAYERPAGAPPAHVRLQEVYIEHTDAYQIVYNANYLAFFLYNLQDFYGPAALVELQRSAGLSLTLLRLLGLRCLAPGLLGDHLEVACTVVERAEGALTWYCACGPAGGGPPLADALLTLGFVGPDGAVTPPPPLLEARPLPEGKVLAQAVLRKRSPAPGPEAREGRCLHVAWLDGVDLSGRLGPGAVLRLFERGRTHFVGGPAGLQALLAAGVKVVVFRMEDVVFHPEALGAAVGLQVEVRTRAAIQDRAMVFHQAVWAAGAPGPCAEGQVVCLAVDAATGQQAPPEAFPALRALFAL